MPEFRAARHETEPQLRGCGRAGQVLICKAVVTASGVSENPGSRLKVSLCEIPSRAFFTRKTH